MVHYNPLPEPHGASLPDGSYSTGTKQIRMSSAGVTERNGEVLQGLCIPISIWIPSDVPFRGSHWTAFLVVETI